MTLTSPEHDEAVKAVVREARTSLELRPRPERYASLSFCVLDAVFSINANYMRSTIHVPERYAEWANLEPLWVPVDQTAPEQDLRDFVSDVERVGVEEFASTVLKNRQLTSTHARKRTLKSEASLEYARILVDAGANTFTGLSELESEADQDRLLRESLARVPGHGRGARLSYFFMLAGDDYGVKPDRMIHRFLERVAGRAFNDHNARRVLADAATELDVTPWVLDHAIWVFETSPATRPA